MYGFAFWQLTFLLDKSSRELCKLLLLIEDNFSFLMWVFDRWSPNSYQNNREKYKDDDEKREFSLKECLSV